MKNLARYVLFVFALSISSQPQAFAQPSNPVAGATASFVTFLASAVLIVCGGYLFGKAAHPSLNITCPNQTELACCSLDKGIFHNCTAGSKQCADYKGPLCVSLNEQTLSSFPLYNEDFSKTSLAVPISIIGTVALIISFATLHSVYQEEKARTLRLAYDQTPPISFGDSLASQSAPRSPPGYYENPLPLSSDPPTYYASVPQAAHSPAPSYHSNPGD